MADSIKKRKDPPKLSRRSFLKSISATSVGVAAVRGEGMVGQLEKAGILEKDQIVGPGTVKANFIVNGQQVATFSLQRSGWSRLTCQIPADAITKNNAIVFRYGYATAPRDVSDSRDRRKLGVRFSSLSIRARTRQGIDAPTNG